MTRLQQEFRLQAGRPRCSRHPDPVQAPKANAIAQRLVGTLRRECLDHVIVVNESHLVRLLREFAAYYNRDRPHRSLDLHPPRPRSLGSTGPIVSRPILGGLHHVYSRAA